MSLHVLGGGGAAAAPPAPTQDPAVAAYLRALGFNDAQAEAQATKQISDINAQTMFQQPEIDYQGGLAREAVQQDTLGRGVYNSGERLVGEARAQHAQQYATGRLQMGASQGIGDVQLQLARALADNEARKQTLLARAASAGGGSAWDGFGWG